MTGLWFAAWRGCDCTDVQADRHQIPETCPCHGTQILGTSAIEPGVTTNLGHQCELPPLREEIR